MGRIFKAMPNISLAITPFSQTARKPVSDEGGCIPAAPVATAATDIGQYDFVAHWNVVSGATAYMFDLSKYADFSINVPAYSNLPVSPGNAQICYGLERKTTYYYRVRSHNSYGTSANSNIITLTTLPGD